jgi:hypothetical protein
MQQNESVQCSICYCASAAFPGVAVLPHRQVPYLYSNYAKIAVKKLTVYILNVRVVR